MMSIRFMQAYVVVAFESRKCGGFDIRLNVAASPRSECQNPEPHLDLCLLVSFWF